VLVVLLVDVLVLLVWVSWDACWVHGYEMNCHWKADLLGLFLGSVDLLQMLLVKLVFLVWVISLILVEVVFFVVPCVMMMFLHLVREYRLHRLPTQHPSVLPT
jgi:hypothetical protein